MALFRGESPVLGTNTVVEIPNGGSSGSNMAKLPPVICFTQSIAAAQANTVIWSAPPAPNTNGVIAFGQYALAGVQVRYATAASVASTLMIEKTPSGTAVGSGTNLLSAAMNLQSSAGTVYTGTLSFAPGLNVNLLSGLDSLSLLVTAAPTSLAGATMTVLVQRVV